MTYRAWLTEVDAIVAGTAGVSIHDLADYNYRDAFEDGMRPAEVASDVLADNGFPA